MKKNAIFVMLILFTAACENTPHNLPKIDEIADSDIILETDEDIIETPSIFDVKVEKNEKNVLSCRLTFNTEENMKMVVRYFAEDHKGYEIAEENENTEHYFFLWGMRAETKYTIEIYDEKNLVEPVYIEQYFSGILPNSIPYTYLAVNEVEKVSEGFLLFTYSGSIESRTFPVAIMIDNDGEVVWYFEYFMSGYNLIGDLQYIEEKGTITIGLMKGPNMAEIPAEEAIEIDLEGNVLWKSPEILSVYYDRGSWHHMYRQLPDGSFVFFNPVFSETTVGDMIINVDRDYNELWSWSYLDHFEPPECTPDKWCDWTHSNSVSMFKEKNVVYLNSRNFSQYLKIDMLTGDVLWKFGKDGDFTLETDNPDPWFEFAHDPEIKNFDSNTIIFYDNGSVERGYSRVIEYKLNFEDMTAEISFVFDGSKIDRKWFAEYWGDADSLPNGNIFVTAGLYDLNQDSRFFEVTRDGKIVWELFMGKEEDWMYTLYNAQKFIPPLKKLD